MALRRRVPLRTCIGCRARRPAGDLVRLVTGPGGAVEVDLDRMRPGRGAWVCLRQECLRLVSGSPRVLARALRRPGVAAPALADTVLAAHVAVCQGLLVRCARAGAAASGAVRLASQAASGAAGFVAVVHATDAGAYAGRAALRAWPLAVHADVGLDARGLGRLVGRGPRAVVAIRPGRLGYRLRAHLRRRLHLGYAHPSLGPPSGGP